MIKDTFRVVTMQETAGGMSWIYRNDKKYCGPFLTRTAALDTVAALEAALETAT